MCSGIISYPSSLQYVVGVSVFNYIYLFQYGCLHVYTELPGFVKQQQNGRWTDDSGVRVSPACIYTCTYSMYNID